MFLKKAGAVIEDSKIEDDEEITLLARRSRNQRLPRMLEDRRAFRQRGRVRSPSGQEFQGRPPQDAVASEMRPYLMRSDRLQPIELRIVARPQTPRLIMNSGPNYLTCPSFCPLYLTCPFFDLDIWPVPCFFPSFAK